MSDPTPGPWEVVDDVRVFPVERGSLIAACSVPLNDDPETDEEWESPEVKAAYETAYANARLIAAAPDLLAALRDFIDNEPCHHDHHGYCQTHGYLQEGMCHMVRGRAAIAKAEGKGGE